MKKTFLVIEDNAEDAALIRRVFSSNKDCTAFVCRNLSEAKAYVAGAGMYGDRKQYPFPHYVICDLKLGNDSGLDFLTWLKNSMELDWLPVTILSGAMSEDETLIAKKSGARSVLRKPARLDEFETLLNALVRSDDGNGRSSRVRRGE